jgi:hypothetical protein
MRNSGGFYEKDTMYLCVGGSGGGVGNKRVYKPGELQFPTQD